MLSFKSTACLEERVNFKFLSLLQWNCLLHLLSAKRLLSKNFSDIIQLDLNDSPFSTACSFFRRYSRYQTCGMNRDVSKAFRKRKQESILPSPFSLLSPRRHPDPSASSSQLNLCSCLRSFFLTPCPGPPQNNFIRCALKLKNRRICTGTFWKVAGEDFSFAEAQLTNFILKYLALKETLLNKFNVCFIDGGFAFEISWRPFAAQ